MNARTTLKLLQPSSGRSGHPGLLGFDGQVAQLEALAAAGNEEARRGLALLADELDALVWLVGALEALLDEPPARPVLDSPPALQTAPAQRLLTLLLRQDGLLAAGLAGARLFPEWVRLLNFPQRWGLPPQNDPHLINPLLT